MIYTCSPRMRKPDGDDEAKANENKSTFFKIVKNKVVRIGRALAQVLVSLEHYNDCNNW